jgi:hypothetical protein
MPAAEIWGVGKNQSFFPADIKSLLIDNTVV